MSDYFGEKADYTSFILWDIDREFQKSYDTYEQWQARNPRKRTRWECLGGKHHDDELGRVLSLGRKVHAIMYEGQEVFGSRFEKGDSTCHSILSAQLVRIQQELYLPLLDCTIGRTTAPIPHHDLVTTARSIRRICYNALRDQYTRLETPVPTPFLPPPRFSVNFCAFSLQLQKDQTTRIHTKKVRPHDRHDEREICPACHAHIAVTPHSGMPEYRKVLFQHHLASSTRSRNEDDAKFACTSCYKTFEDAYGFLDHVFQKEIGSEQSCQRRWSSQCSSPQSSDSNLGYVNEAFMESNPALVEKCLRNCLRRELIRMKTFKQKEVQ